MRTRQNTWAPSTFQQSSTLNSFGSNSRNIYHNNPSARRSTYPQANACCHPLIPSSSSATLLATATNTSNASPFYYLAGRPATISSATTTTQHSSPSATFLSRASIPMTPQLSSRLVRAPPVFHAQSVLFMFGFLFFPCWWVGAFYIGGLQTVKGQRANKTFSSRPRPYHHYQYHSHDRRCRRCRQGIATATVDLLPIHPSMLANGWVSPRALIVHPLVVCNMNDEGEEQELLGGAAAVAWAERERAMFRQWNRWMSFASVGMLGFVIIMLVWYHIGVRGSRS